MGTTDPRVDAYIAKSAPFAQPILTHLRAIVHEACPSVVETMKWSFPHFDYKGIFCAMAAFKAHATFGFWKGSLLRDSLSGMPAGGEQAMGQFGRIASLDDLPPDRTLMKIVKAAALLNDKKIAVKRATAKSKPPLKVPPYLMTALRKNTAVLGHWEAFPPSHRREYVEWIADAKQDETRQRRMAKAIAQIAEGKSQNWKYQK